MLFAVDVLPTKGTENQSWHREIEGTPCIEHR